MPGVEPAVPTWPRPEAASAAEAEADRHIEFHRRKRGTPCGPTPCRGSIGRCPGRSGRVRYTRCCLYPCRLHICRRVHRACRIRTNLCRRKWCKLRFWRASRRPVAALPHKPASCWQARRPRRLRWRFATAPGFGSCSLRCPVERFVAAPIAPIPGRAPGFPARKPLARGHGFQQRPGQRLQRQPFRLAGSGRESRPVCASWPTAKGSRIETGLPAI